MAITFEINHSESYYVAKWQGRLTDEEVISVYKAFFNNGGWIPGYNALTDMSEFDGTAITNEGMGALQKLAEKTFSQHDVHPKVAVYAPRDLPFGLSRMYSAQVESFVSHAAFRDKEKALEWLKSNNQA